MKATHIRVGNVIRYDGMTGVVLESIHRTPGNLPAFMMVRCRDLERNTTANLKISSDKTVEKISLDKRSCQYLYQDGDHQIFMDNETYEQFPLDKGLLEGVMTYIRLNDSVDVLYLDAKPISVELPPAVILEVTETEEVARGNTANAVTKDATLETGLVVKVPAHIKTGERLKISTESGDFLERAKE